MNPWTPCDFTWEPPRGPYTSVEMLSGPIHRCVLKKGHKGDHTSVDGERLSTDEVLVDRLPMRVNLGMIENWRSHIGWAKIKRDPETGRNKIVIEIDEESNEKLGNMVNMFKLYAIGFAGIKLQPERDDPSGG
jgi:hypothetical protein